MRCYWLAPAWAALICLLLPGRGWTDDEGDLVATLREANKLLSAGKSAEALPLYEKAAPLAVKVFGENHLNTAAILNNLASLYKDQERYAEAEPIYLRSLAIFEKIHGKEHLAIVDSLNNLAVFYSRQGKYVQAQTLYQRTVAIYEKAHGKEHVLVAIGLSNVANMCNYQGKDAEAAAYYQRCLAIFEKTLGEDHPAVAQALNNLAIVNGRLGQYDQAEAHFKRSLAIYEKVRGKENPTVAESLSNFAILYVEQGKFGEAERLYKRALAIYQKVHGGEHAAVAECFNNFGILYMRQGRFADAESYYKRTLSIREKLLGKDHLDVADALNNMAILFVEQGKYVEAEPLYQRSLKLREQRLGNDSTLVADVLNNLGLLYRHLGKYADAEAFHQRSLAIYEKVRGKEHIDVADSINNLGLLYERQLQFAKAESSYRRSLAMREKLLGKEHLEVADSLNNLANLYVNQRKYADAKQLFARSLGIRETILGPEHPAVAAILNNLAILDWELGNFAEAKTGYQRSLHIYEKVHGKQHPGRLCVLGNLVILNGDQGDFEEAKRLQAQLRDSMRQYLLRELPGLSAREQRIFLNGTENADFARALSLGLRHATDAKFVTPSAGWLANGKAIGVESQAIRGRLDRETVDADGRALLEEIQSLRSQEAVLALKSGSAKKLAPIIEKRERLEMRRRELEKQLAQRGVGATTLVNAEVELTDVRKNIPPDGVLIDIARFRPFRFWIKGRQTRWDAARYVAWVMPPVGAGNIHVVDLGDAAAIDAAIMAVAQSVEATPNGLKLRSERALENASLEKLTAVAKQVFEPLKPHLGTAKKIILSPDGDLWILPWAALPTGNDRYLVDDYNLRFVVSSRDLVEAKEKTNAQTSPPLIVADPDYDLRPTQVADVGPKQLAKAEFDDRPKVDSRGVAHMRRLPNTVKEARQAFAKLKMLTGKEPRLCLQAEASEAVVKTTRSPDVLVLATHGFFLQKQEVDLRDAQWQGIGQGSDKTLALIRDVEGQMIENPLLRCGLLLAGANKRQETMDGEDDGILTGLEIIGMDLRGTRMVVLSACETGLGDIHTGEGVAGLRQAFQLAGAESVLATLWQIPDEATVELMNTFYDELAKGADRAEALATAQRHFLKVRRDRKDATHPYFWASFTLTGK